MAVAAAAVVGGMGARGYTTTATTDYDYHITMTSIVVGAWGHIRDIGIVVGAKVEWTVGAWGHITTTTTDKLHPLAGGPWPGGGPSP